MATEKERIESSLTEWKMERDWCKKVIADPNAEEKYKTNARQRLKVAETWIKKIIDKYPEMA